jgi:hypothetical protein
MLSSSLFSEFKQSLKNPAAEEGLDLVFFRPLAFLLVKAFGWLPVTPNQISCCSMVAGISAAVSFSNGNRQGFLMGALLYTLANILDCCDGMVARLKKNGTLTGRIVDGVVDYVNGAAVYLGFGVGLAKAVHAGQLLLPCNSWLLIITAAASFGVHAMLSDKYRNAYLEQARQGGGDGVVDEIAKFSAEQASLKGCKGRYGDKILIAVYLKYLAMQQATAAQAPRRPVQVKRVPASTVVLWNCIGPSTHIAFLVVPAIIFQPAIFFLYVIGAANVWMLLLLALQARSSSQGR